MRRVVSMNRQKKSCKMMGKKTLKSCGFKALRKWQAKLILILVLVSILQEGYLMQSTGDDHTCLKNLKQALGGSQGGLSVWPDQFLSTPCYKSSQSNLTGINCNDNRVVSILLNGMSLSGSVSSSIANCNQLNALDLSNNTLSGSIPPEIGQLSNLAKLNLSVNHLKGSIPDALANCTYLSVIDLHRNRLTGYIPQNLGTLQRLSVFDVSYNDLSGQVPYSLANTSTGAVRFNISSFKGNKHLYGYPLPDPKVHNLSVLAIVGIGLGSGMLSLIVSFTAVCIWLRVSEQHLAAEEGKISQLMPE